MTRLPMRVASGSAAGSGIPQSKKAGSTLLSDSGADSVKSMSSARLEPVRSRPSANRSSSHAFATAGRGMLDRPGSGRLSLCVPQPTGAEPPPLCSAPLCKEKVGRLGSADAGMTLQHAVIAPAKPDWKDLIVNIYREKAPEKLEGVDSLLMVYRGEEEALYFRLCERFGFKPDISKACVLEPPKSIFVKSVVSTFDGNVDQVLPVASPNLILGNGLQNAASVRRPKVVDESSKESKRFSSGRDWFSELFGFPEDAYRNEGPAGYKATQDRLKAYPKGSEWVFSCSDGQMYHAGKFWTPSLRELRSSVGKMGKLPGILSVKNIVRDVGQLLADESNQHATFQVASQFNCLEFTSENRTPELGVTGYVHDKTQGPACAVACGPSTVFRNYLVDVGGCRGQTSTRQINNLRGVLSKLNNDTHKYLQVKNGYTLADSNGLAALNSTLDGLSTKAYEDLRGELRIGVHEDAQVTSCDWGHTQIRDENHTVTQVLGSACSVSYSKPCSDRSKWAPFARFVLSASYEATLLAGLASALRHPGKGGSNRVYLTSLGGGVFGNHEEWIIDAMASAFEKFQTTGLEVYIVSYGRIQEGYDALTR